ncbi:MAG: helix-turn-helix domain-containing protein [Alphaproteobacteria bacterium]|jgi:excisionase family DNA binding protein|nr:helix-turn-helix domain-containing protein [Alphaproteobacteria bacterium]
MERPQTQPAASEPISYNISEAVRVSGLSRTTLYKLIHEKRLEKRKIGKRTLIPAASLRALIEGAKA